jgi:hypothetical protein
MNPDLNNIVQLVGFVKSIATTLFFKGDGHKTGNYPF